MDKALVGGLSSHCRSVSSAAMAPLPLLLSNCKIEEEICLLKQKKARARKQKELQDLCKKEAQNFSSDKDVAGSLSHSTMFCNQVAMKKAPQAFDLTPYMKKSQKTFDTYVKKVKHTFSIQPTIYLSEQLKCLYAGQFLGAIPLEDWDNYQRQIEEMKEQEWSFENIFEMHQDHLNPKHIQQYDIWVRIKELLQQNGQSLTEMISYFVSLEKKLELAPIEAEQFKSLYTTLHKYLRDVFVQRENPVTTRPQLEETALLLESTLVSPFGITVMKPRIARRGEAPK